MSHQIAMVLPPRERFRAADAGAAALTIYALNRVSHYGDSVLVFGGQEDHFADVNYEYVPVPFVWFLGRNLAYARSCIQSLRTKSIPLIEVHNRVVLALRIKKAFPDRMVTMHFHNDSWGMGGSRTVKERQHLLQTLDAAYCVSEYVAKRLLDGVQPELAAKVHVVHNPIEPTDVQAESARHNWIVYSGRFIPEKGVLELAKALAILLPKYPSWKTVFLGAWGFGHEAGRSQYEKDVYAALSTVAEQVDFRGHVSHATVLETLRQAKISVAPSTGIDAFPRAPLEAMDAGCAVILSTSGGLPEIAGDAGVLVSPVNVETLTVALESLIKDEQYRLECAVKCQNRARENFTVNKQVAILDSVRSKLLRIK